MSRWPLVLLCSCLVGGAPALAQSVAEPSVDSPACTHHLGGSWRNAYYSRAGDFQQPDDVLASALWLKGQGECGESLSSVGELVAYSDDALRGRRSGLRVREAYVQWRDENWSARVGRQVLVWGRADRFNPTDNLTPRDYTLLAPEETDQRDGLDALRLTYRHNEFSLSGLLFAPRFRPHHVPMEVPPGLAVEEPRVSGAQGALKLDHSGGDVDWSLSYFNGFDLAPNFALREQPAGPPTLLLTHPRMRALGGDVATVLGRYGLRAEAAYVWTAHRSDQDWLTRRPFFYLVAGGDRTFESDLNVNLQLTWRHTAGFRAPDATLDAGQRALVDQALASWSQNRANQYGLSVRVADKWLNDTVEAEIASWVSLVEREHAVRARLIWHANDQLKLTLGTDQYGGRRDTFFGQIKARSTVFLQAQLGF